MYAHSIFKILDGKDDRAAFP